MNWKAKLYLFSLFLLELAVISWYLLENKEYLTDKQKAEREAVVALQDSILLADSLKLAKEAKLIQEKSDEEVIDSLKNANESIAEKIKSEMEDKAKKETETAEEKEINNKRIAKIYENMKPDAASRVLSRLDVDEIAGILGKIKQKKAAKIIAAMNSKLAADVTKKMLTTN